MRSVLAVDPEDEAVARPFLADSRAAYLERFAEWRSQLAASWRSEGLSYTLAATSEPASRVVRRVAGVALGARAVPSSVREEAR
jgi:hypothetical protein